MLAHSEEDAQLYTGLKIVDYTWAAFIHVESHNYINFSFVSEPTDSTQRMIFIKNNDEDIYALGIILLSLVNPRAYHTHVQSRSAYAIDPTTTIWKQQPELLSPYTSKYNLNVLNLIQSCFLKHPVKQILKRFRRVANNLGVDLKAPIRIEPTNY
jgi:hypothetical protein